MHERVDLNLILNDPGRFLFCPEPYSKTPACVNPPGPRPVCRYTIRRLHLYDYFLEASA